MRSKPWIVIATLLAVLPQLALTPSAGAAAKYKVLHTFGENGDGTIPYGPPALDWKGNLYGVTITGGTGSCSDYGCGTVFELKSRANGPWKEAILHNFTAGSDGSAPTGGLITDSRRNLYGTIEGDGSFAVGAVFELSPKSGDWRYTVLYTGNAGPGLVSDKLGNLYGEMGRGQYKYGAIGELSPGSSGWNYTDLYSFCVFQCGYNPSAPPIWDGKGNMFGITTDGGIAQPACWTFAGCGVIFEMKPNGDGTWTYHILHHFASDKSDGQTPWAGLVMDNAGNFYGSTVAGGRYGHGNGGYGNGTVFKLSFTASRWKKTALYEFPHCADGCGPLGTMAFDKAGNLYGAAQGGLPSCGGFDCGVIFKLSPQTGGQWTYSVLHRLTGTDGDYPIGVIVDGKGNLFGTTERGGTYNSGVAFEITP